MVCFKVLGECQRVYLNHLSDDYQGTNLIQHALRGEVSETASAFKPVIRVVMLRGVSTMIGAWGEKVSA